MALIIGACVLVASLAAVAAAARALLSSREGSGDPTPLRTQDFSRDPGWVGLNNRRLDRCVTTHQDFGWRREGAAGGPGGSVGGLVTRAVEPGYYGKPVSLDLERPFRASGRLVVRRVGDLRFPSGSVMIGFFHHSIRDWRAPNSLVMRLDSDAGPGGYGVGVEYGSRAYRAGGAGLLRPGPGERPVTFSLRRAYRWELAYDPAAVGGLGEVTLTMAGAAPVRVALSPKARREGASFDRFGITFPVNARGKAMDVRVDGLTLDGVREDLSRDPGWIGSGNRVRRRDCLTGKSHQFGWTGAADGRVGGMIWRTDEKKPGRRAFYADRTGPLTLADRLHAEGTVQLDRANSDSATLLGWFDSRATGGGRALVAPGFVGVAIRGPSRDGQYFSPVIAPSRGRVISRRSLLLNPSPRSLPWTLDWYPPDGRLGGRVGRMVVRLGDRRLEWRPKPSVIARGASMDHFGLRNVERGGSFQVVFFDDLRYTIAAGRRGPSTSAP